MSVLDQLISRADAANCQKVWQYFLDLTQIPRQSGHEEKAAEYIIKFAQDRGLSFEKDSHNNVLIEVPATTSLENKPGFIIQSHLDMVCVGTPDPAINGVTAHIDGDWLKATNTSLGGDNGIGVALSLALVDEPHGPLALMFTTDEEVGMGGALNLSFKNDLKKYSYLINVDSEEDDTVTISSAGGVDTVINFSLDNVKPSNTSVLNISGLPGGHSGVEIHKNIPNSIKQALAVLNLIKNINIVSFNAGTARNVIPNSVEVIYSLDKNESSEKLLSLLNELPHGVIAMSQKVEGLVETSTNLAKVTTKDSEVIIEMMTRSSVNKDIVDVQNKIVEIGQKYGATVTAGVPYPGWPAEPDSSLIKIITDKKEMKIEAIHAGLECGAIKSKYPHLEAVSLGPNLQNVHSVNEQLSIPSVGTFYTLLRSILC